MTLKYELLRQPRTWAKWAVACKVRFVARISRQIPNIWCKISARSAFVACSVRCPHRKLSCICFWIIMTLLKYENNCYSPGQDKEQFINITSRAAAGGTNSSVWGAKIKFYQKEIHINLVDKPCLPDFLFWEGLLPVSSAFTLNRLRVQREQKKRKHYSTASCGGVLTIENAGDWVAALPLTEHQKRWAKYPAFWAIYMRVFWWLYTTKLIWF